MTFKNGSCHTQLSNYIELVENIVLSITNPN